MKNTKNTEKWYIGVDGGGTKTAVALSRGDGVAAFRAELSGCSHREIGIDGAVSVVMSGIEKCLAEAGAALSDCAGCCLGMPCYGESAELDVRLEKELRRALYPVPVYVVNDVEVARAGALGGRSGIHVVAGTGSIACGVGDDGVSARCGGWDEFFGDEGSCYWVGREAMSLFSKQADGRAPRGALYDAVRETCGIEDDTEFNDYVIERLKRRRDAVASFQMTAQKAAEAGDMSVRELYERAARELALNVKSLKERLTFFDNKNEKNENHEAHEAHENCETHENQENHKKIPVSYSGGLFRAGETVLAPFRREIEALGCTLFAPIAGAVEGALILAVNKFRLGD